MKNYLFIISVCCTSLLHAMQGRVAAIPGYRTLISIKPAVPQQPVQVNQAKVVVVTPIKTGEPALKNK